MGASEPESLDLELTAINEPTPRSLRREATSSELQQNPIYADLLAKKYMYFGNVGQMDFHDRHRLVRAGFETQFAPAFAFGNPATQRPLEDTDNALFIRPIEAQMTAQQKEQYLKWYTDRLEKQVGEILTPAADKDHQET